MGTDAGRAPGGGVRTVRTVAELRAGAGSVARRGGLDRPGTHDGRPARWPPVADRAAPASAARWSWSRCSSTRPSSTPARTWPPTRATRSATAPWPPRRAPICCSRPRRGGLPPGFATHVQVGGADRGAGGRRAGPRALPRRHHGGGQAAEHGGPGRRLLRAQGRPAGAGGDPHGARPRLPGRGRGVPHRPRTRRPGDVQPQRPPARRGARASAGAQPGAGRRRAVGGRRRARRARGGSPRRRR